MNRWKEDFSRVFSQIAKLEKELEQQHQKLDQYKIDSTERIVGLTNQANQTSQQLQQLLGEYRTILDSNVEMRTELETYNRLLSAEEGR